MSFCVEEMLGMIENCWGKILQRKLIHKVQQNELYKNSPTCSETIN